MFAMYAERSVPPGCARQVTLQVPLRKTRSVVAVGVHPSEHAIDARRVVGIRVEGRVITRLAVGRVAQLDVVGPARHEALPGQSVDQLRSPVWTGLDRDPVHPGGWDDEQRAVATRQAAVAVTTVAKQDRQPGRGSRSKRHSPPPGDDEAGDLACPVLDKELNRSRRRARRGNGATAPTEHDDQPLRLRGNTCSGRFRANRTQVAGRRHKRADAEHHDHAGYDSTGSRHGTPRSPEPPTVRHPSRCEVKPLQSLRSARAGCQSRNSTTLELGLRYWL
jgi:hypothetical protein